MGQDEGRPAATGAGKPGEPVERRPGGDADGTSRSGGPRLSVVSAALEAALFLVATPIGNARDITLRALDVLNSADMLAAEDTRNLRHLMDIHGIALRGRRIIAYHDHNAERARPAILAALRSGQSVAYASDAGTPLVADPGYRLARAVAAEGLTVRALPGPSAMLAGLCVSGLPSDRFLFVGFPPAAAGPRRRWVEGWAGIEATVIAYESPRRVRELLEELCELDPERDTVICRELTKRFEEVMRGSVRELHEAIPQTGLRGEVVVLFGPPRPREAAPEDVAAALRELLGTLPVREAAARVAARFNLGRREVYALALSLREDME